MLRMIHESAEAARLGKQVKSEAGESFEMSLRVAKEKAILAEQEQMRRHNMSGQQRADSARSPKESEAAAASKRPSATWAQRVSNLAARAWRSYGIAVLIVVLAACASSALAYAGGYVSGRWLLGIPPPPPPPPAPKWWDFGLW